jgi:signal transduction histidine kinase
MNIKRLLKHKRILVVYFSWIFFLSLIYFLAISFKINALVPLSWALIGLSGIAAIVAGIYAYMPATRKGFMCLAVANLLFIFGDTYYNIQEFIFHRSNAFPSLADIFYLITYPLFIAGMVIFIRSRTAGRSEKGAILDAAIFALGLAMLLWVYLIIPSASADASLTVKTLSISYPVFDILVWAMLVRLLLTGIRIRAIQFLAVGAVGLIISDIVYAFNQFYGVWNNGSFIDVGWICFYSFWGAAALHPSMKSLDKPFSKDPKVYVAPLFLLAATALLAPMLLIIEFFRGNIRRDVVSIAIFSAILFVLVILRMAILVRAITRQEAEITLERQKNEAFSLVSHQLKTPVTAVKQLLALLLEGYVGKVSTSQREILVKAYGDNQRLLRIVEDLLNVGQIDSGSLILNKSEVDVVALIKEILREEIPQLERHKQKIKFKHATTKLQASIDSDRLSMVLENIIDNASKYSANGKVIEITLIKMSRSFKISVQDQGVGINQHDLGRLFRKFSRLDNPLSKEVGGTGLGLYWAKKIIDQHGGSIKVKSKPEQGSTFIISLPL